MLFLLIATKGYSQRELKFYRTAFERLGIGIGCFKNEHIGFELGSSYWLKNTSNYYINADVKSREINFYTNAMIKKYSANKIDNAGFFIGGYIRYWMNLRTIIDDDNWTIEQKSDAENANGWRSKRSHKISLGYLIGYKTQFSSKLSIGFTFGLGSSIRPSFWEKVTRYDYAVDIYYPYDDPLFGRLTLISTIGQVSINYRFGKF